ncbi:MAG: tyrosine-type recombinase/integrase [Myxococcales bacterium]|nr:tyrosine-type recombinase/integrase [Myxococcales bacterium]
MARRNPFAHLPPFALEFLQSKPSAGVVLSQFHGWLKASYRPLLQLDRSEIDRFLQQLAKASVPEHARTRRRRVALMYFEWLHARGLLGFDPRCAWPRSNFPLPPSASRFLELLKPTHSLQCVRSYQTHLRQLHIWLNANHVSVVCLQRCHLESWLAWLHARGLAACTRVNAIQNVRAYLEWLEEQRLLSVPANTLIRSSDLPKLPNYLPRPVAPDIDLVLQRRLKKSGCIYQLGLLLMRCTGLRIGELIALPYQCTRSDHSGNTLLKVPLGKLATERLVPLDPSTVKLIAKLRRLGPRKRSWLLATATGHKTRYELYREALCKACRGLVFAESMTTHRLRHTYATSLLAAGMSLPSVMRLLGHTDYRMTLRYAEISGSTVHSEFAAALERIAERYPTVLPQAPSAPSPLDPMKSLSEVARYIQKRTQDDALDRHAARLLVRRARRLQADLRRLLRKSPR